MDRIIYAISKILDWISRIVLILLALSVFLDVVMRGIGRPLTGNVEVAEILLVVIVYFAVAYTHRQRGHIRVEILYNRFSPRTKDLLDSIIYTMATVVYGFMVWALASRFSSMVTSTGAGPLSPGALQIPISPLFALVALGLLVFCLELLLDLMKTMMRIRGRPLAMH